MVARRRIASWVLAASLALPAPMTAQSPPPREYQLKAVFLFNFAQFVDWPATALPEPQTPMVIGILGEDPFGSYLDETIKGETVNNHPLVVQRYRRVEDITSCHILFVAQGEQGRFKEILATLKGRSILTVSDAERFSRAGGMIRFVTDNNHIRLRVNVEAAKAANLTISSKLLRPAEIVTAEKG